MRYLLFILFALSAMGQSVPMSHNMIAHWRFQDNATNCVDVINGYALNASGAILPKLTNGIMGNGLACGDGANSVLQCTSTNLKRLSATNFCLGVWVRPTNYNNTYSQLQLVNCYGNGGAEWFLTTSGTEGGILAFGNGDNYIKSYDAILTNEWNFIVFGRNGANWECWYFNSLHPDGTGRQTTFIAGSVGANFAVGNDTGGQGCNMLGEIDSLTVWTRYLSYREMQWLYGMGTGALDYFTAVSFRPTRGPSTGETNEIPTPPCTPITAGDVVVSGGSYVADEFNYAYIYDTFVWASVNGSDPTSLYWSLMDSGYSDLTTETSLAYYPIWDGASYAYYTESDTTLYLLAWIKNDCTESSYYSSLIPLYVYAYVPP